MQTAVQTQGDDVKTYETQEEILGRKLAFYISALQVPNDVKSTLIESVPLMERKQAEDFMIALEAAYLEQETKEVDEIFRAELDQIEQDHVAQSISLDEELIGRIRGLMRTLQTT